MLRSPVLRTATLAAVPSISEIPFSSIPDFQNQRRYLLPIPLRRAFQLGEVQLLHLPERGRDPLHARGIFAP